MKAEKMCRRHNNGAGEVLPAASFYVITNRQGKPALAGYCKECAKQAGKEWNKAHPELARERVRQVFVRNPEKRKEYQDKRTAYHADYERESRRKTPMRHWKYHIKKRYGVTPEWYEAKLAEQGGTCALCPEVLGEQRNRMLSVDHNHQTGAVRGLLCPRCNNTLERLEAHDGWAERALAYLSSYKAA